MKSRNENAMPPNSSLHHQLRRPATTGIAASMSSCHPRPLLLAFTTIYIYILSVPLPSSSAISLPPIITPNFAASYEQLIDHSGAFLASQNNTFEARVTNSMSHSASFYLVVVHVSSNIIIWSANRNDPVSKSSQLQLTARGLALYHQTDHPIWSTPSNLAPVAGLQLLESGNLVLLDVANHTLWESFASPTDVLVVGQKLPQGMSLVSSVRENDLSEGRYRFMIGDDDAMLEWDRVKYWNLSTDENAFRERSIPVEYLLMNFTGVYLVGKNGEQIVVNVILHNPSNIQSFQIAKLESNGVFSIVSINPIDGSHRKILSGPKDSCEVPLLCGRLGLCTKGGTCQCAPQFHNPKTNTRGCVPMDNSLALPGPCNSSSDVANIVYLDLTNHLNDLSKYVGKPVAQSTTLSACQNICSRNCSCLGVIYRQDSGYCFMIREDYSDYTFVSNSTLYNMSDIAYIKTVKNGKGFNVLIVALTMSLGVPVIALVVTLVWLKMKNRWLVTPVTDFELGGGISSSEGTDNFAHFPGLPTRFDYKELAVATQDFRTKIGSGGFGTVYKGTLVDGTDVAVKRIDCLGAEAKREFLTEIAAIGKLHHVNLVQLKGFCTHKGQKFLVYEYMNQGSLDRNLFRGKPPLEWKERYKIALGTARGLEYLHTCCEHKIIHCDVKPENILLNDSLEVKISDFGLSKLLTQEQSGIFTLVRGTRGYIAPEWLMNTAISEKSDVYSFGMLLLEIASGKRNFFLQPDSNRSENSPASPDYECQQVNFPLCALEMHLERRYLELVDPRLTDQVPSEEVEKLVQIALCCVHCEPNLRPSMSDVVRMLEGEKALSKPKIKSLNFLRLYDPEAVAENGMQQNEVVHCQEMSSMNIVNNSISHISSQQVSGPR